ncbi:enoyl-CoA hydratase [Phytohabitans kaempferiae]|uniref:Enoyl-CoA hydratase n=1 Tax=Phytohabitans kaempferiae TaxID=1620943 RepID=A0ABV6MHD9_9ACTN
MTSWKYMSYEKTSNGRIAIIALQRPEARNAQHRGLLVELDQAFMKAEADDEVRVVVLRGEGASFSAGHDLGSADARKLREPGPDQHQTYRENGGTRHGAERRMLQEWHYFFDNTKRWRNLRKTTIASVQGPVVSGGLMLMWACDLIVAADDAYFADVVGTRYGMCGLEYFGHPWELGPRRAKELLLTGDSIDADEAYRIGMVNKVFPADRLVEETLRFAERIADVPTMTALLIKDSVNQTLDQQGFSNALASAFSLHTINHSHWAEINPNGASIATGSDGVPRWRDAGPIRPARKDAAGGEPVEGP